MAWQNGLYQLTATGGTSYTVMLRIDLHPDNITPSYVSLDLYRGFLAPSGDPDQAEIQGTLQYLGSFRSAELGAQAVLPPAAPIALNGLLDTPGTIALTLLPPTAPSDLSLPVRYDGSGAVAPVPTGQLSFDAVWQGAALRVLHVDIERSPGLPSPEAATATLANGVVSFSDCFNAAGIMAVVNGPGAAKLPDQTWTLDQLRPIADSKVTQGWSMHAYLMLVSQLDGSPGTTGAMFEQNSRSAAAVFYQSLYSAFHRDDDNGAELNANYLFTAVHELGHCLNLPHCFEGWNPNLTSSSATFMNYPQAYTGNFDSRNMGKFRGLSSGWNDAELTSYRNFWSFFQFDFCPAELLELRHGALRDEETGQGVSQYRGIFTGSLVSLTLGGPSGAGMELELRVRRERPRGGASAARSERGQGRQATPAIFDFGEPIHVEARLRSHLKQPRPVKRRLSAVTGDLQIHYQRPDGSFQMHRPPAALCYVAEEKVIDGNDATPEPDSFYKDVCLNVGDGSFGFLMPGKYRVRASYRYHDTLLVSNVLELYVRNPTPQVENVVVPLLAPDVATYFAFRGVHGLPEAKARLEATFDGGESPDALKHPLYYYYCANQARLRQNGSVEVNPRTGVVSRATLQGDALRWFPRALGFGDLNDLKGRDKAKMRGLPFSNIRLAKLALAFHKALTDAKEPELAAALAVKIDAAMKSRRVPQKLRRKYLPPMPAAEPAGGGPH